MNLMYCVNRDHDCNRCHPWCFSWNALGWVTIHKELLQAHMVTTKVILLYTIVSVFPRCAVTAD